MTVKHVVSEQYKTTVNRASKTVGTLGVVPPEGWIATCRKALGMSAAQLARRAGLSRSRISTVEKKESSGSVTLRTMQSTAEAMGCRFVYAIVPKDGSVEAAIQVQARRRAESVIERAGTHMALENQSLSEDKAREAVDRMAEEFVRSPPPDLWQEK